MPDKILTPVMYEDSISGLNLVKPVSFGKIVNQDIDYGVLAERAAAAKDTPNGRWVRCNGNGGILTSSDFIAQDEFIFTAIAIYGSPSLWYFDFGRVVEWVLLRLFNWVSGSYVVWVDNSGILELGTYQSNVPYCVPFRGQIMYFYLYAPLPPMSLSLYGFYK